MPTQNPNKPSQQPGKEITVFSLATAIVNITVWYTPQDEPTIIVSSASLILAVVLRELAEWWHERKSG